MSKEFDYLLVTWKIDGTVLYAEKPVGRIMNTGKSWGDGTMWEVCATGNWCYTQQGAADAEARHAFEHAERKKS